MQHTEFVQEKHYPLDSSDLVSTAPSIDLWSMPEMLWQRIYEIFIYLVQRWKFLILSEQKTDFASCLLISGHVFHVCFMHIKYIFHAY